MEDYREQKKPRIKEVIKRLLRETIKRIKEAF